VVTALNIYGAGRMGGVEDLKKCRWYLDRLIEVAKV
jgi:hypothetical protein